MNGLELSEKFYFEIIKPIVLEHIPELNGKIASGLIGYGSDVIGNDDEYSNDHEWGPRALLFLSEESHGEYGKRLYDLLNSKLPNIFEGYPTRFIGTDVGFVMNEKEKGKHHISVTYPERFLELTIGIKGLPTKSIDWLSISEQRLLEFTAGRIYEDEIGRISKFRNDLHYFPDEIWLFRLAFALESLGWEDDLIFMCGLRRDSLSMHINAMKTIERLMRLSFLLNKKYAPLSPKWLHREFMKLPEISNAIGDNLERIAVGQDYQEKTDALNEIYETTLSFLESLDICDIHLRLNRKECSGVRYDIQKSAKDVWDKVDGELKRLSFNGLPSGAIDQWVTNEDVLMSAEHMKSIKAVFGTKNLTRNNIGDEYI
jgi:hypothetical protein